MRSLSRPVLAGLVALAVLCAGTGKAGTVYLVVGSDTAIWDGLDTTRYHCHFGLDLYTSSQGAAAQAIDPSFRSQFIDSYGQPLKMTWWMMAGNIFGAADNMNVPEVNTMACHLMRQYHGEALRQLGDEIGLHYHTFLWSDYSHDGVFYWNEARTFHESWQDFDSTLAQVFLEEEYFPASFRSGWHYMDNEWQQRLNALIPFSLHNASPNVHADSVEPLQNIYNWSKATTNFVPFHPSTTNYQVAGAGPGWNVRSVKMPSVTQAMMDQVFEQAANGTNQVACLWAHLEEVDFLTNVARIDLLAHAAASNYPAASFRYCTAVEAMQRWLGATNGGPPVLDVAESVKGDVVTLSLSVDQPIFQPQPFVALKDVFHQYRLVACEPVSMNRWTATLPVTRPLLAKVGVAVTDPVGNVAARILRYLPDDVYVDNADPQYAEAEGPWQSTTNAAWGTDARLALLGANDTARAQWSLPVPATGYYHILAQVPWVSGAAGNVRFTVVANGSNIATSFFPASLPPNEWVPLFTPCLSTTGNVTVEMVVNSSGQSGTYAVADIIKMTPLAVPMPGFIENVVVDAGDTTANLTWTTLAPASAVVEFGLEPSYGSFSTTNPIPLTNHVATLSGLAPGTTYYCQIDCAAGEMQYSYRGQLTTADQSTTAPLLELTNAWRYTAANVGSNSAWRTRSFDDSNWLMGPALLWVDTRSAGPNPAVQPRLTEMPTNPVTGHPFVTYYFRTHFVSSNGLAGTVLTFSNYLDDGAVFYLNGVEVRRAFMPGGAVKNSTLANDYHCSSGDATCPYVFSLGGQPLTNLVAGDNVLAVEVHNYSTNSPDITFGTALWATTLVTPPPTLKFMRSGDLTALYWNDSGATLQRTDVLDPASNRWVNMAGPGALSPCLITNAVSGFYRLRK
jgi:hypothetical protein